MSVEFYKKGSERVINGLLCNTLMVAPELFDGRNVPEGWFLTPEDAYRPTREESAGIESARLAMQQRVIDNSFLETEGADVDEQVEEIKKEPEAEEAKEKPEEIKVLTGNAKIRNDAKELGMKDWRTARITTLEKKLKA